MNESIQFTKIKHDVNGNPRYVCHFLNLLTEKEKSAEFHRFYGFGAASHLYTIAVKRANKIGGRKFQNKSYGGGIVFQSYNISDTARSIKEAVAKAL